MQNNPNAALAVCTRQRGVEMRNVLMMLMLAGCELSNTLPKNECRTDADCNPGNTCQAGICVGPGGGTTGGGGGGCSGLPPAECSSAEGNVHSLDLSELQRLLPGRWLWCKGDSFGGSELVIGGAGTVGIDFNADATRWWFLYDDGHGQPMQHMGFGVGGTVQFVAGGSAPQVNLVDETGWFNLLASITDGPPMHLRLISGGPSSYYVHVDCGTLQPGYDGGAAAGPFGGTCDPNVLLPNSCPAADGVACSFCVSMANASPQCLQPCKMAGGGCTGGQSCIPLPQSYTRGGDCVGFDGYCQ
jgi:hypothetical protein